MGITNRLHPRPFHANLIIYNYNLLGAKGDYANKTYLDTLTQDTLFAYAWLYWGKTKASRLTPEEKLGATQAG